MQNARPVVEFAPGELVEARRVVVVAALLQGVHLLRGLQLGEVEVVSGTVRNQGNFETLVDEVGVEVALESQGGLPMI